MEKPVNLNNLPPEFFPGSKQESFACIKIKPNIVFDVFQICYLKRSIGKLCPIVVSDLSSYVV